MDRDNRDNRDKYNRERINTDREDRGNNKMRKLDEQAPHEPVKDIPVPQAPADTPEGHKLFVLCSKRVSEDVLYEQFEGFGEMVGCKLVRDQGGQSKGYAFVVYAEKAAAVSAIEHMNGNELYGTEMKVFFADKGAQKTAEELEAGLAVEEEAPNPLEEAQRQARLQSAVVEGVKAAQTAQKEIDDRLSKSLQTRQYNEDEYDY